MPTTSMKCARGCVCVCVCVCMCVCGVYMHNFADIFTVIITLHTLYQVHSCYHSPTFSATHINNNNIAYDTSCPIGTLKCIRNSLECTKTNLKVSMMLNFQGSMPQTPLVVYLRTGFFTPLPTLTLINCD